MNTYKNKLFVIALMISAMAFGTQSCSDDEGKVYTGIVGGLSLSADRATLLVNETVKLEAKVYPEDAPDKDMTWKSDNSSVATVDNNGLVTAVSFGTANVTVTAAGNEGLVRTCVVTVVSSFEISISTANLRIKPRAVSTLKAEILPSNIDQSVTWSSSNTSIATVNDNGAVTAVTPGTATVTATSVVDQSKTAECAVTVVNVSSVVANDKIESIWKFDDSNALGKSFLGADLIPHGEGFAAIDGPDALNGAVRVDQGSYYEALHGIVTGEGQRVNNYTVMFDFRVSQLGRYYCFVQTSLDNNDDGEFFLRPAGNFGIGGTGYSAYVSPTNEWHRLVISAALGSSYNYYIDGNLVHQGNLADASPGSKYSWSPEGVLFLADNDGEDAEIDIAEIAVWSDALTDIQIAELGGIGGEDESSPLVGVWRFEDAANLSKATVGADLVAGGEAYTSIDGPGNSKAAKPGAGSNYKVVHGIGANGGGAKVNEYTLMMDVYGSASEFAGWLSVLNTRDGNSGEGVVWIDGSGYIGYASLGGYSNAVTLTSDAWHRVVMTAKLGESVKIYVDGVLAFNATQNIEVDGLVSLPLDGFHIGADGTGYPGPSYAEVRIWNVQLTDAQVAELGGAQ